MSCRDGFGPFGGAAAQPVVLLSVILATDSMVGILGILIYYLVRLTQT